MEKIFAFQSNCIITSGLYRSLLCDLNTNKFIVVNKLIGVFYDTYVESGFSQNDIQNFEKKNNLDLSLLLMQFQEKGYIIELLKSEKENFPSISFNKKIEPRITLCELELDIKNLERAQKLINSLNTHSCKDILLFSSEKLELEIIKRFMSQIEFNQILNVNILFKYHKKVHFWSEDELLELYTSYKRLNPLICYDFGQMKKIATFRTMPLLIGIPDIKNKSSMSFIADPNLFLLSLTTFNESQNGNLYYNGRMAITEKGEIKRSLFFDDVVFGHITKESNYNIILDESFFKLSNISKDVIDYCKDCEFRYVCFDPRVPQKIDDSFYKFDSSCGYDIKNYEFS